jgi:hypothetical protein
LGGGSEDVCYALGYIYIVCVCVCVCFVIIMISLSNILMFGFEEKGGVIGICNIIFAYCVEYFLFLSCFLFGVGWCGGYDSLSSWECFIFKSSF